MIGTVYDYLMATVIVGVIFVAAVVVVPNASYMNVLYVDQQQVRNVALETLKAMLLDPGYPVNWGSQTPFDQNSIKRFGLAYSGAPSFYILDPEKVQRLVTGCPAGNVEYEVIREKLGLQGYGFCIRIRPLFNVTVDDMSTGDDLLFSVNVRHHDGRPIPNALVTATLLYVETSGAKENFDFITLLGDTDELGKCTIVHHLPALTGYILVLKVTVADLATITIPYLEGFAQNVAEASIIGDTVALNIPVGEHPSERTILNMTCVSEDEVWNYPGVGGRNPEDKMNYGEGYQYWIQHLPGLSHDRPLFLIFNIHTQEEDVGKKHMVLFAVSPLIDIQSGLLQFGSSSTQSSSAAVRLTRSVDIWDMTYIFELLLWKEL